MFHIYTHIIFYVYEITSLTFDHGQTDKTKDQESAMHKRLNLAKTVASLTDQHTTEWLE